jgi:hypothetical protein
VLSVRETALERRLLQDQFVFGDASFFGIKFTRTAWASRVAAIDHEAIASLMRFRIDWRSIDDAGIEYGNEKPVRTLGHSGSYVLLRHGHGERIFDDIIREDAVAEEPILAGEDVVSGGGHLITIGTQLFEWLALAANYSKCVGGIALRLSQFEGKKLGIHIDGGSGSISDVFQFVSNRHLSPLIGEGQGAAYPEFPGNPWSLRREQSALSYASLLGRIESGKRGCCQRQQGNNESGCLYFTFFCGAALIAFGGWLVFRARSENAVLLAVAVVIIGGSLLLLPTLGLA